VLRQFGPEQRRALSDLYESRKPRLKRETKLRALKRILSSSPSLTDGTNDHFNDHFVEYIDELLCCCREASATISPWVGDA